MPLTACLTLVSHCASYALTHTSMGAAMPRPAPPPQGLSAGCKAETGLFPSPCNASVSPALWLLRKSCRYDPIIRRGRPDVIGHRNQRCLTGNGRDVHQGRIMATSGRMYMRMCVREMRECTTERKRERRETDKGREENEREKVQIQRKGGEGGR